MPRAQIWLSSPLRSCPRIESVSSSHARQIKPGTIVKFNEAPHMIRG